VDVGKDQVRKHVQQMARARRLSHAFNHCNPPTPISFPEALLLSLDEGQRVLFLASFESGIVGSDEKASESGQEETQSRRQARDAFSHFTFVHSAGKHVVVDMHGTSGGSYSKLNILDFETQEGIADMVSRVKRGPCEGSTCGKRLVSSRTCVTA
jgi:hypothetical protein